MSLKSKVIVCVIVRAIVRAIVRENVLSDRRRQYEKIISHGFKMICNEFYVSVAVGVTKESPHRE
jgi:hypothetical protein